MVEHLDARLVWRLALNCVLLPWCSQQLVQMAILKAQQVLVALGPLHVLDEEFGAVLKSLGDVAL